MKNEKQSNIVYQIRLRNTNLWYESGRHFTTKSQSRSPTYVSKERAEAKIKELGRLQRKDYHPGAICPDTLEVVIIRMKIVGVLQ